MKTPKVSIIIPVYNVEPWIERCVHSLFTQTLDDIEYIFVDDCSPDDSVNIMLRVLNEYPHRKNQVKTIRHEHNQGVAAARISGMKAATGEYIIHCDPDDWVEKAMYQVMMQKAKESSADVIMCNFMIHPVNGQPIEQRLAHYDTPQDCVAGYCRKGGFYYSSCNKLVRRSLIENYQLYPPVGISIGEDANMSLKLLHFAKSVSFCDDFLYHYNLSNINSLTHRQDIRANFEMGRKNTEDMVSFLMEKNPKKYRATANFLKFCAKIKILRANPRDIDFFYETYKDCRKDIFKFTCEPLRARIIHACMLYNKSFLRFYQNKKH